MGAEAALGDPFDQPLALRSRQIFRRHLAGEIPGADRIDPDLVARQLQGQRPGQMHQPRLGGGIADHLLLRPQAEDGGDVDDAAAMAEAHHMPRCFLGHQPGALEIGVQHEIPIGLALLQHGLGDGDPGVVDQDGDRPQLRLCRGHGLLHAFGFRDVKDDRHGAAVEALDLLGQRRERCDLSPRQSHPRAGPGQGQGELPPQATARPGHDGRASGEIEARHQRPLRR